MSYNKTNGGFFFVSILISQTSKVMFTLASLARHINPCLVTVQPRKTNFDIPEKLLTGM